MEGLIITREMLRSVGRGRSNGVVWVLVRDPLGQLRIDSLQPEEQSPHMEALQSISDEVSRAMTRVVREYTRKPQE